MDRRIWGMRRWSLLLAVGVSSVALAACGSSSSGSSESASSLLKQTFTGSHTVTSGNLSFRLTLSPSGSTTLKGPVALSFGGPFQSRGTGKLPASNFNISFGALGQSGSIAILSTGTAGYVTVQGTSFQLPAASFQKLESSFSQVSTSPAGNSASGSGGLSKLGIDPLHWLINPSVVGTENVGGAQTTHIRAGIDVAALLGDVDTFLQKASSLGVSGTSSLPTSIPQATKTRIAGEVKNPTVDVWTGNGDKTLRKLSLNLTVPVSGQVSSSLGGLNAAGIGLSLQYANLNQPQTITPPTNVRPYSEFQTELQSFLGQVEGALGGASTASTGSGGSTGATGSGPAAPANITNYSKCIQAAGGDVSKMQRCASLLNGK
jgi:hypothetical protein